MIMMSVPGPRYSAHFALFAVQLTWIQVRLKVLSRLKASVDHL